VGPVEPVGEGAAVSALIAEPGVVVLRGRLDVTTVADVRAVLHAAVDDATGDLIVDVSQVDLLDATGLGVLVGTHRRALHAGRRLVLRDVPPRLSRLLLRTRLHRVLFLERTPAAVA